MCLYYTYIHVTHCEELLLAYKPFKFTLSNPYEIAFISLSYMGDIGFDIKAHIEYRLKPIKKIHPKFSGKIISHSPKIICHFLIESAIDRW